MHRSMVPFRSLCVLALLASTPLVAAISYPPPTILTGGSGPFAIAVADLNNDCADVSLRAERYGAGTGRIYTITVTCTDGGGHTTTKTVVVNVPLSQN